MNKERMISLPVHVVVPGPATAEANGGNAVSCYPGTAQGPVVLVRVGLSSVHLELDVTDFLT